MFIYKDLPTISPEPQRPSGHQAERRGASARNSNGKAETSVELAEALVFVCSRCSRFTGNIMIMQL
jgi:hypothetical protein